MKDFERIRIHQLKKEALKALGGFCAVCDEYHSATLHDSVAPKRDEITVHGTPKEVAMVMSHHGLTYEQATNFAAFCVGLDLERPRMFDTQTGMEIDSGGIIHWETSEISKILFLRSLVEKNPQEFV